MRDMLKQLVEWNLRTFRMYVSMFTMAQRRIRESLKKEALINMTGTGGCSNRESSQLFPRLSLFVALFSAAPFLSAYCPRSTPGARTPHTNRISARNEARVRYFIARAFVLQVRFHSDTN